MVTKRIENLRIGDMLKQKSNNQLCTIKEIIIEDEDEPQKNFVFDGFAVKEKVMKKFFQTTDQQVTIYNNTGGN
jgi:hypothetical protein